MNILKRSLSVVLCLIITLFCFCSCDNSGRKKTNGEKLYGVLNSHTHTIVIDIKDYGKITVALDGKTAPITVDNFVSLINDKFYDGLTFHRIIDDFMIQGGAPKGNGTGGSENKIKGEFSANGVQNDISHIRGVISMARSGNSYNSASSQFFIVQKDSPHLDGQYAAFGYVLDGMEIVDKIAQNTKVENSNGTVLPENQPVINSIAVTETN